MKIAVVYSSILQRVRWTLWGMNKIYKVLCCISKRGEKRLGIFASIFLRTEKSFILSFRHWDVVSKCVFRACRVVKRHPWKVKHLYCGSSFISFQSCTCQLSKIAHKNLLSEDTDYWCFHLMTFNKQLNMKKLYITIFSEMQGLLTLFSWTTPVNLTVVHAGLMTASWRQCQSINSVEISPALL